MTPTMQECADRATSQAVRMINDDCTALGVSPLPNLSRVRLRVLNAMADYQSRMDQIRPKPKNMAAADWEEVKGGPRKSSQNRTAAGSGAI